MDANHNFFAGTLAMRPALGLQILCQALDELDLDAEPGIRATGLDRQFLETPGQLIRKDQEVAFIEAVLAGNERPDLAFRVGQRYHYGVFGVWGLALITSENLLQAMDVAQEFIELTHSFAGLGLDIRGDVATVWLEQGYPDGPVGDFVIERDLVITLVIASEAAGRRLPVRGVDVSIPRPAHARQFERLVNCRVNWGASDSAAHIDLDVLRSTLPQANAITWSACVRQCRELIARQRGGRPFESQVRQAIAETRFAGINAVCERLHLPERSLRRRLASRGSSFRRLTQDLRRELAEQYLSDAELTLDQVAEKLGYSETANFCHAFRRWHGQTPGAFRRGQGSGLACGR